MMTPMERSLRARIANAQRLASAGNDDRRALTAAANAARRDKWLKLADPNGVLSPDERSRRAKQLEKAHMLRMSLRALRARQEREQRR